MAELLPQGTLGIRKIIGYLTTGNSMTLSDFGPGLYIYQNTSATHSIGLALLFSNGDVSVISEAEQFTFGSETTDNIYLTKSGDDVVVYNKTSYPRGFTVVCIS